VYRWTRTKSAARKRVSRKSSSCDTHPKRYSKALVPKDTYERIIRIKVSQYHFFYDGLNNPFRTRACDADFAQEYGDPPLAPEVATAGGSWGRHDNAVGLYACLRKSVMFSKNWSVRQRISAMLQNRELLCFPAPRI
jgi:hypothetical protein